MKWTFNGGPEVSLFSTRDLFQSLMGLEKHDGRYSFFFRNFFIYFPLSLVFPNLYAVFFSIEHKMVNDQYSLYIFPSKILLFCISKLYMHM